jgi:tRNA threonylcarbamoyladenosine biosynthesis protein TsaE
MKDTTMNETALKTWGKQLGSQFRGGECIELIGDVGAGKTTLTKGIALGMGINDEVQSPTFTLSRIYETDKLDLHHYDFYRLTEAGVMGYELAESLSDPRAVTVIEWAETVSDVLPEERIVITLRYTPDGEDRVVTCRVPKGYNYISL